MNNFDFDNILSGDEVEELFSDEVELVESNEQSEENTQENKQEETTEVNTETLFTDKPESVGSEENVQEQGDHSSDEGSSPDTNVYSFIATAFRDEGILPDLDDDSLKNIKTSEDFASAIEKQIEARLDDRQRRIDQALNYGVEVPEINRYENTINYIDSITDDMINDESEQGEQLRKQLIKQDYLNRGFTSDRADKEVEKSFNAGTDLDDAKEAKRSNREYFVGEYQNLVEDARLQREREIEEIRKESDKLRKSLLDKDEVFEGVSLNKVTRQKVWDNLTKPVYTDDNGISYSAIQNYERENKSDFMKKLGVIFTLTDGFKNLDGLVKGKVTKENKKNLRELEHVLKSSQQSFGGPLEFMSGVSDDPEAHLSLNLDI